MSKYIKRNKVRTLLVALLLLFVLVVSVANSRMMSPYFFRPSSSGAVFEAGDALLLESGDYLLLENGDKLLLE